MGRIVKEKITIGKDWGTDIVPKEKWINTDCAYKTRSGQDVIHLDIVLKNSQGHEVTFPVKGSIVLKRNKKGTPTRTRYTIWMLDGRASLFGDHEDDLILQEKNNECLCL